MATNANLTSITERIDNTTAEGDGGAIYAVTGIKAAKGAYAATTCTAVTEAERGVISLAINPYPEYIQHTGLTAGWQTIMSTLISASSLHMTHRGGRRPWMRVYDPGATAGDIQLRLMWRALGSSRWTEDNAVATVPVIDDWALVDLDSVLPQVASLGNERWEGNLMARALSGSGSIRLRDFYPLPTEQYAVVSEANPDPIDGELIKGPGTMEDSNAVGTLTWSNVNNAKTLDGTYAQVETSGVFEVQSHYLKATNFGFAIPEGATIKGVKVAIARKGQFEGYIREKVVKLVNEGTVEGENKALTGEAGMWSTSLVQMEYGGSESLWGLSSPTPTKFNKSNFGVVLSIADALASKAIAYVDWIGLTIYYTEGASQNRICFATRSLEFRSDGVIRQALTDDVWGSVVPNGFLPYAPPGGADGRTERTIIIPTQGDFEARADTGSNKITSQRFTRAGHHVAREAA